LATVALTNATVTGDRVWLSASIGWQTTTGNATATFTIYRDSIAVGNEIFIVPESGGNGNTMNVASFDCVDVPPSGSHTYFLVVSGSTATTGILTGPISLTAAIISA
jgi:hypothetical protein